MTMFTNCNGLNEPLHKITGERYFLPLEAYVSCETFCPPNQRSLMTSMTVFYCVGKGHVHVFLFHSSREKHIQVWAKASFDVSYVLHVCFIPQLHNLPSFMDKTTSFSGCFIFMHTQMDCCVVYISYSSKIFPKYI